VIPFIRTISTILFIVAIISSIKNIKIKKSDNKIIHNPSYEGSQYINLSEIKINKKNLCSSCLSKNVSPSNTVEDVITGTYESSVNSQQILMINIMVRDTLQREGGCYKCKYEVESILDKIRNS
jgi:hypothetical protein